MLELMQQHKHLGCMYVRTTWPQEMKDKNLRRRTGLVSSEEGRVLLRFRTFSPKLEDALHLSFYYSHRLPA